MTIGLGGFPFWDSDGNVGPIPNIEKNFFERKIFGGAKDRALPYLYGPERKKSSSPMATSQERIPFFSRKRIMKLVVYMCCHTPQIWEG